MSTPMKPNKNGRVYNGALLAQLFADVGLGAVAPVVVHGRTREHIKDVECEVVEDEERKALPAPRPELREGEDRA